MYYEFYIDQFAAEHFLGGCLLLMITARVLKRKAPCWRIVTGSIVQTAIMILFLFGGMSLRHPAVWTAVCILAGGTAGILVFGEKSAEGVIRVSGTLAAVTVCFGGILQAVLNLVNLPVLIGGIAAGTILRILVDQIVCRNAKKRETTENRCMVTLKTEKKSLQLQAILDTGNSLREPLTGKPVSIISADMAKQLLDQDWEKEKGFFLIPYHSLGTEKAWMKGFLVRTLRTEREGEFTESENAVLAIYEGQISSAKHCQMILHPEHHS